MNLIMIKVKNRQTLELPICGWKTPSHKDLNLFNLKLSFYRIVTNLIILTIIVATRMVVSRLKK